MLQRALAMSMGGGEEVRQIDRQMDGLICINRQIYHMDIYKQIYGWTDDQVDRLADGQMVN